MYNQGNPLLGYTMNVQQLTMYTKQKKKPLRLISYRAISHTGFVYPTTWGNSPCSVRYRAEGGSLPSYTPTVPPAQRWLFRETCVSRAKDKAGVLNAFIQFNPLPRETIELDGRPIETSISKNYSCKLWKFLFFCLFGFFPSATITACPCPIKRKCNTILEAMKFARSNDEKSRKTIRTHTISGEGLFF